MGNVRVAAVQTSPVFLDRAATTEKVSMLVEKAAGEGAALIVFPETFIPTYPDWVWRTRPWDRNFTALYERLFDQAVEIPSDTTRAIGAAARAAAAYVSIGVNERDGGTLYNTQLLFDDDGEIVLAHRKLMPTGGERLVWGMGDGSTLSVAETPFGRVGGLTCWENYMPLARAAIYAKGVDIYVAPTWDNSDVWVPTMQHIAKEGRMHVIGVNFCLRGSDVASSVPGRDEIYGGEEDWLAKGNTVICGPDGGILAGPLVGEEGIVTADLDVEGARAARFQFDVSGHYARPDVLSLRVNESPTTSVSFESVRPD